MIDFPDLLSRIAKAVVANDGAAEPGHGGICDTAIARGLRRGRIGIVGGAVCRDRLVSVAPGHQRVAGQTRWTALPCCNMLEMRGFYSRTRVHPAVTTPALPRI